MGLLYRAAEMAVWESCLLCKPEEPSSNPYYTPKVWAWLLAPVTPALQGREGRSWELTNQPVYPK